MIFHQKAFKTAFASTFFQVAAKEFLNWKKRK
jgi:hypothetical protein